jgi:hypothetical protein
MKLNEVSAGQDNRTSFAKSHVAWYRAQAAKYDITVDGSGNSSHDGYPLVRKEISYFGGAILPKGGWKKEEDSMRIPLRKRARFLMKDLAKELEKYAVEGRHIFVGRAKMNPSKHDSLHAGEIETFLLGMSGLDDPNHPNGTPHKVVWAISNLKE